jgi:hypothetical protein
VEPGPLPPHERAWRHPSELGPPPHEPTSTVGRVLIATSAAVSLLLIGLLAIAITPDRSPEPIAASSTVSDVAASPAVLISSTASAAVTQTALPVVTPIGDDGWAVTTWDAVGGETGWMEARLPSGVEVQIEIVGSDPTTGLVVVTLPTSADTDGYKLAAQPPRPSDTVVVHAAEPQVVSLLDLAYLDFEEGTPVLDAAGELVGLCTGSYDGTTLMTVDTMPGDNATAGADTTTAVETTAPPTTIEAATTVESPESTSPESSEPATSLEQSTTLESTTPDRAQPTAPDAPARGSAGPAYPPGR